MDMQEREIIPKEEEPKYAGQTNNTNMWQYHGSIITEYTLKNQRFIIMEHDGNWTRPKVEISVNSLPDET